MLRFVLMLAATIVSIFCLGASLAAWQNTDDLQAGMYLIMFICLVVIAVELIVN